jgi:hypothetical protein
VLLVLLGAFFAAFDRVSGLESTFPTVLDRFGGGRKIRCPDRKKRLSTPGSSQKSALGKPVSDPLRVRACSAP